MPELGEADHMAAAHNSESPSAAAEQCDLQVSLSLSLSKKLVTQKHLKQKLLTCNQLT